MHSYPLFDRADQATNLAFARERGFGTLAVNHETGPLMSHVPFVMDAEGTTAEMHLARNNGLLRVIDGGASAVLSVSGPDGYVSPDWYGTADQVPTWNYVAVTLRGRASLRPAEEMRAQIDRLSAQFERRIEGKTPWTSEKMSAGVVDRMMRAIVLVRLDIEAVEGTWKLGQNKPDAARLAAAEQIEAGSGMALSLLAELMRTAE